MARPGARKRTLFALALAAGMWAVAEGGAWLALRYLEGPAFSLDRIRDEQRLRAGMPVITEPAEGEVAFPRGLEYLAKHVAHPYLGFVRDPTSGDNRFIPVTEWGFADHAPPFHHRSDDRVIVGIVGGSVARNFGLEGTTAFAEALRASGPFAGRESVFVRLGLGGFKQPQQLQTVSYLLSLGAEFDLIVNIDGFNEVALWEFGNGRTGVFPAFPRAWAFRARRLPDPDTQVAMGRVADLRDRQRSWAEAFVDSAWSRSPLADLLWRARDARLNAAIAHFEGELRSRGSGARRYVETGPHIELASDDDAYDTLVGIWRRSSLQLARLCRANGIAYVHFLQPNQYVEGSKPMGEAERRTAVPVPSPYRKGVELGYPRLQRAGEWLSRSGIAFADLTQVFRDVEQPIYTDDCCHMSAAGHEILAREMAAFIAASVHAEPEALFAQP